MEGLIRKSNRKTYILPEMRAYLQIKAETPQVKWVSPTRGSNLCNGKRKKRKKRQAIF
jgi:hypothetical protein